MKCNKIVNASLFKFIHSDIYKEKGIEVIIYIYRERDRYRYIDIYRYYKVFLKVMIIHEKVLNIRPL